MCQQFLQIQSHYDTPFDDTPLLPDEFLMKISNLQNQSVQQLPNLIEKVLSDKEPTDIELQQLSDIDLAILMKVKDKSKTKTKRPDELQKMFFKRAIKFAQKRFFYKKKTKRINAFYKHYFNEASQKLGCSLINFYHPNKQIKSGLQTGQKTFNATYIKFILGSSLFRSNCKQYLNKFVKDSLKQRSVKIRKFIQTCRKIASSESPIKVSNKINKSLLLKDEQYEQQLGMQMQLLKYDLNNKVMHAKICGIQRLQTYFSSAKCKIPWCDKDIQMAYKCAKQTLEQYLDPDPQPN